MHQTTNTTYTDTDTHRNTGTHRHTEKETQTHRERHTNLQTNRLLKAKRDAVSNAGAAFWIKVPGNEAQKVEEGGPDSREAFGGVAQQQDARLNVHDVVALLERQQVKEKRLRCA